MSCDIQRRLKSFSFSLFHVLIPQRPEMVTGIICPNPGVFQVQSGSMLWISRFFFIKSEVYSSIDTPETDGGLPES